MTLAVLLAYIHLVASVLLVGYFLFWLIMTVGLVRLEPPSDIGPLTSAMLAGARWPPAGVPWALRLTLPGLGWTFLAVLVLTGIAGSLGGARYPVAGALGLKLALVAALAVAHARLGRRPTPGLARLSLGLALGIVVASVLLSR
ncbi:MAG TPA: hypothetical protein VJQ44_05865 [Gemmatimonadales bacterium]|nr:hypothetical protein [Gemmatimonadales bacterium]